MVAYQNPIIFFLTIPSGATSGERVVIDGVDGVIQVFGPSSTGPNNGLVAEIGNGVGLEVFGALSTMQLTANPDGSAAINFWLNSAPTNQAVMFMGSDGSLRMNSQEWTSTVTGHPTFATMVMASPTGAKVIELGFIDATTDLFEQPLVLLTEDGGQAQLRARSDVILTTPSTKLQLQESPNFLFFAPDTVNFPNNALAINSGVNGQSAIVVFNESWHPLPLVNGWTPAAPGTDQAPQYRWYPDNTVGIRGIMTGGTSANFCTLPVGYRPAFTCQFPAIAATGATAGTSTSVVIRNTGVMSLSGVTVSGQQIGWGEIRFALD